MIFSSCQFLSALMNIFNKNYGGGLFLDLSSKFIPSQTVNGAEIFAELSKSLCCLWEAFFAFDAFPHFYLLHNHFLLVPSKPLVNIHLKHFSPCFLIYELTHHSHAIL